MDVVYSCLWLAWLAAFAVIEGLALHNDMPGDTLSEHTRKWFRVDTHIGRTVWLVASGVFAAWYITHIAH